SKPENWSLFTYEILNNFAYSLIEKPEDVRNETFPYDRLLIVPLPERRSRNGDYDLPFYLFQAVYVECNDQKIQKGRYSLLKPFQSPVEEFDEKTEDARRFHARSFQEVSDAGGRKRRLNEYLQKHYVGADPGDSEKAGSKRAGAEPASYVVRTASSSKEARDARTEWTQWAFRRFWFDTRKDAALWNGFLCDLTESYCLIRDKAATDQDRLWFLCRYGLLQSVVHFVKDDAPEDRHFKTIQQDYARELSLRFGGNKDLDLLSALISEQGVDPVEVLEQDKLILDGPREIAFVDYLLNTQDRWAREFLKTLTELVCGKTHEQDQRCETYFQDLLTRPVAGDASPDVSEHHRAAEQIGNRIPPYEEIAAGSDTIATFLGVLSLTIGTTDLERRRLRCIIVMMRDYDDTKTGRVQSESEARKRLEVDRGDLTLYTRTFFQNVHRFLTTARERQQVRVLSTDITQIARSWYSSGIDFVVTSLLDRLHELVEGPETQKLGRLRPEIIDCAFLSLLSVMIRPEKRRGGIRDIELESFPFDRFLHVPLLLGPTAAARWCYARTDFETSPNSAERYKQIRTRGRHVLLRGGMKIVAPPSPIYLGPGEFFATSDKNHEAVRDLLGRLAEPSLLDRFVRRLNETHALQTLAVAGSIYHLFKQPEGMDGHRGGLAGAERVARELRGVIERSVRSLEREGGLVTVLTEAHMDRPVSLDKAGSKDKKNTGSEGLLELFGNVKAVPFFHEFFAAVEGPDYEYGLNSDGSKIFYVYYSIPAPDGFIERDELDSKYRGLYCLIVDDAKTDDKRQPDDDGPSDAEEADLEDIRTFIHNAMCNLGQVLGQQALHHRLLRPGVAQDILGMMHRLKNELNGPVSTLSNMKRALATPELLLEHTRELTNDLDSADGAIMGIHDLFHNMKKLSEFEHGNIPLQSFSSDWLAWTFVVKLCQACVKAIGKQRGSGSENRATREINKICDDARANIVAATSLSGAPGKAKTHESTNAIENVQKALFNLAVIFGREYSPPPETKVEFIFGFQAFTIDKPLEFRGSYLLDEALDTLIDNAFQALLSYLDIKIQSQEPNVVGRMGMICRQDEANNDEILLELRNSSNALAPRLLEELNADPPRTVSAAIHAEVSGKKGGSGFGHYFARRIVSEYCGGRQARRQLDIRIGYEAGLARTRLRLLKAQAGGTRAITAADLSRALTSEFKDAADLTRDLRLEDGAGYRLPSELQLRGLLRTLRDTLAEGWKTKFDDFFHFVKLGLCQELMACADILRNGLIESIGKAEPAHPELLGLVALLRDPSECR
ncbi:MAG TPA: hypothetical protein VN181_10960, partial [Thermoanaerobaculia bacterium]|nr:hypothetical protein [Thermoanaerobaculia bacterium]